MATTGNDDERRARNELREFARTGERWGVEFADDDERRDAKRGKLILHFFYRRKRREHSPKRRRERLRAMLHEPLPDPYESVLGYPGLPRSVVAGVRFNVSARK